MEREWQSERRKEVAVFILNNRVTHKRDRETSHTAGRQFLLTAAILVQRVEVMPQCLPSFPRRWCRAAVNIDPSIRGCSRGPCLHPCVHCDLLTETPPCRRCVSHCPAPSQAAYQLSLFFAFQWLLHTWRKI